jgi:hypothetical protein
MTIVPGPWQDEIARVAERCARGDLRTAMAMLLAAYGKLVSRCVTSEHVSAEWLLAAAELHQAASEQLAAVARMYRRDDAVAIDALQDAQSAAVALAEELRERYEALRPLDDLV